MIFHDFNDYFVAIIVIVFHQASPNISICISDVFHTFHDFSFIIHDFHHFHHFSLVIFLVYHVLFSLIS